MLSSRAWWRTTGSQLLHGQWCPAEPDVFSCAALQSGRLCIAVPSSEAQPKGMVLGGSSAAGVLYVEPQAAVPLNNDLAAARGEAYAAVESVLWSLTGLIADAEDDMQHALDTVSHFHP